MPQYDYFPEDTYLGFIVEQSTEPIDVDIGADASQAATSAPELGLDVPIPTTKLRLPLYTVLTVPKREILRNCLPVFPMGCSPGYSDTFGYRKGELVLVQYSGTRGYPLILGAVPIFAKDKARSGVLASAESRVIQVGGSRIEIGVDYVDIQGEYYGIRIEPTQITLKTTYIPLFTLSENGFTLGPISFDEGTVRISSNLQVDAGTVRHNTRELVDSAVESSMISSLRNENITNLVRSVEYEEEAVGALRQYVTNLEIFLDDFRESGTTPKATVTANSTLQEEGGIVIQKADAANPEKVAKAETLLQELRQFVWWAKTHIHKTSGAPPDTPPPDFTEGWHSELLETD